MKKKWQKKEIADSKLFGSRRMPRSGGLWFAKGDSRSETYLIENKTTKHQSYSISTSLWEKLEGEALLSQRIPLLSIQFGDEDTELVIIDKDDFINLLKKYGTNKS